MENIKRDLKRRDFVVNTCGLDKAEILPLVEDASARIYFRIKNPDGKTFVLMDDVSGRCKTYEFSELAEFLAANGVRVPKVLFKDIDGGFLLLEDLGDNTFTKLLPHSDARELYRVGTDLISRVAAIGNRPTCVKDMSREFVLKDISLFSEWYYPFTTGHPLSDEANREFQEIISNIIELGFKAPKSLVLWDYHVDNLMQLPETKEGAVIDFQDALWGPVLYDPVSLLEDARNEIPEDIVREMKQRFYENLGSMSREDFEDAWAFFSLHRHLRVLGRFTTLMVCNRKTRYLKFIPHIWKMLEKTLEYPKLAKMKSWMDKYMPKEQRGLPKLKPIDKAFMLAAGRGVRMEHLTDNLPKPLIEVNDKALIDYNFDKISELNIKDVIVNICYQGNKIRNHLALQKGFNITYSEEQEALETGGGVKKALPLLGENAFFVLNSDTFWIEGGYKSALWKMYAAWEDDKYDVLLLLHPLDKIIGDRSIGDYKIENGRLFRNTEKVSGFPYMFAGVSIIHPRAFANSPDGKFSLREIFDAAAEKGRLGYVVNEGTLLHVGTPKALELAEKSIKCSGF